MAATVRGKEIIFPIGADRVKVDGEWVEIDGLVGFDGTDAVLPKSVLDKLLD
jgi:hypothetical protein